MFKQNKMSQLVGDHYSLVPLNQLPKLYQQSLLVQNCDLLPNEIIELEQLTAGFVEQNGNKLFGVAMIHASSVCQAARDDGLVEPNMKFDKKFMAKWNDDENFDLDDDALLPVMLSVDDNKALDGLLALPRMMKFLSEGATLMSVLFVPTLEQVRRVFGDRYHASVLARCTEKEPSAFVDALDDRLSVTPFGSLQGRVKIQIALEMAARGVWEVSDAIDLHSISQLDAYNDTLVGVSMLQRKGLCSGRRTLEQMEENSKRLDCPIDEKPMLVMNAFHHPLIAWVSKLPLGSKVDELREEIIDRQNRAYGTSVAWITGAIKRHGLSALHQHAH